MQVEVHPLTEFRHDRMDYARGRPAMVEESTARDWERRGMVRVVTAPAPKAPTPGKAIAAGTAQPSSALPAAPALPPTTSKPSGRGGKRTAAPDA